MNKINEINPGARPNVIVIDFEKAAELALRTVFPATTIHGCFFHFKVVFILFIKINSNILSKHYGGKFKNLDGQPDTKMKQMDSGFN